MQIIIDVVNPKPSKSSSILSEISGVSARFRPFQNFHQLYLPASQQHPVSGLPRAARSRRADAFEWRRHPKRASPGLWGSNMLPANLRNPFCSWLWKMDKTGRLSNLPWCLSWLLLLLLLSFLWLWLLLLLWWSSSLLSIIFHRLGMIHLIHGA